MTDRGTRVRWTTAALVAPAAAAVFTGTTVWASGHEPATASTPTTAAAAPAPAPTADPLVAALRVQIDQNTAQVDRLRQTVANLQAQAAAIAKGIAVPRTTSRPTSTAPSSRTSSRTTSAPTTRTAAAPAPAPVTHTTTGASGVVK